MKKYKNTIILIVTAAVLIGVYFLVSGLIKNGQAAGNDIISDEKAYISKVGDTELSKMVIENENGKFVFEYTDEWALVSPDNFPRYEFRCSIVPLDFLNIGVMRVIEKDAKELSQYGLDKPSVTISMTYKDGKELRVYLGNQTPTKNGWYAKNNESENVYTIADSYQSDMVQVSSTYLMDRTIFSEVPEEISELKLSKGNETIFHLRRQFEEADFWDLLAPFSALMDLTQIKSILIDTINVKIEDFIESDVTNMSKYGLAEPIYTLDVVTENKGVVTLYLGSEIVRDSMMYACIKGENDVFYIDPSSLTYLDKPLRDVVDLSIYMVNINEMESVDYNIGGKLGKLVYKADPDNIKANDVFTIDGTEITEVTSSGLNLGRALYAATLVVTADDVDAAPLEYTTPALTVTFNRLDGESIKVEYVTYDDLYYGIFKNGQYTHFIILKESLSGVNQAFDRVIESVK